MSELGPSLPSRNAGGMSGLPRKMRPFGVAALSKNIDLLAEEAVFCEPVSYCDSLLRGRLQGILKENGVIAAFQDDFPEQSHGVTGKFPKRLSREFFAW
jgi:hypothetical protein